MARQIAKSNTSSTSNVKQTNTQKNTQTQIDKTKSKVKQTSSNESKSYKDLSGLSPQTIALQNRVFNQTGYTPSQSVTNAATQKTAAEQALNNLGKYKSTYQPALEQTLNDILNRKSFNYDFNTDALYQNYRDSYEQQGRQAAQNAAAAASALTGGYGNSYATSAANQANEEYMTQLNDKIPELYQLALDRYNMETQNLHDTYNALGTQEDRAYGQWSDERANLVADRDYYGNNYASERDYDMTMHQNEYENLMNLLNYRTNLEVKDVTKGSSKSTTKENSKNTSKDTTKNTNTTNTTSKDNQSTVTNTQSSGSSKSGSTSSKTTNVNKTSGTNTPDNRVQEVMKTFKEKMKVGYDSETGAYNEKSVNDAWDYLNEKVDNGFILEADEEWIVNVTGAAVPKK